MEELRILRGINRAGFTSEQAAAILPVVESWDRQRAAVETAGNIQLAAAARSLQESLAKVETVPTLEVPAEASYYRILQEVRTQQEEARRAARERLVELLKSGATPAQAQALLAVAREAMLQSRLESPAPDGNQAVDAALRDLERLRQTDPEAYPRQRDFMARRYAGAFNMASMRNYFQQLRERSREGGVRPELPPIEDPAAARRVARCQAMFDQVRAMPPAVWQQQRTGLAAHLARERELARIQSAGEDELVPFFVDQFLLQPRSAAALRARFK